MTMATMRNTAAGTPALRAAQVRRPKWSQGWLGAGFAVCVVGWGANQFTPLLLMYRSRLGLSAAVVEATFGLYAIGLIPGLLVAGPLSDRIGRRRVVLSALGLSLLACCVLALSGYGDGWLFAGRLIMGTASGSAFSAGAAWIKELSAPPYEGAAPGAGARRAGGAMTLGFGLGPLVAGVLAQWAPLPTVLPYLPQLALTACALPLAVRTPETVRPEEAPQRRLLRIRGLGEPRFLWVVLPLAPWVFISASIAMVYVPGLVTDDVSGFAVVFAAVVAVCTAFAGVLAQPLARRLDRPGRPMLLLTGLTLVIVGVLAEAGITALGPLGSGLPVLVALAAVVLGCGYGICLVFGLAEVQRLARPDQLAGMTAVFQAVTYVGFAAPYVLTLLHRYASATQLLLCVAGLAALTLAFTTWRSRRTTPSPN
jgi:predicted MFS family arabinose efflux permease